MDPYLQVIEAFRRMRFPDSIDVVVDFAPSNRLDAECCSDALTVARTKQMTAAVAEDFSARGLGPNLQASCENLAVPAASAKVELFVYFVAYSVKFLAVDVD